jgi:hypothetical protein
MGAAMQHILCELSLVQLLDLRLSTPSPLAKADLSPICLSSKDATGYFAPFVSLTEKTAFLVNLYNIVCRAAIRVDGAPAMNDVSRYFFFSKPRISVAGLTYSLDDIENGLLRGNRKSPMSLCLLPFRQGDPRANMCLPGADYRIHAVLNCGAQSCPPLRTLSGALPAPAPSQDLSPLVLDELDMAADGFFADASFRDGTLFLSKIVDWYREDFGATDAAIAAKVQRHLPLKTQQEVAAWQATHTGAHVSLAFLKYVWSA